MPDDYVEDLPLSAEEKRKISSLGAPSAVALLSMMRAAPDTFEDYLGSDRTQALEVALENSVKEPERAILGSPIKRFHASGAIISRKAPLLRQPKYGVAERDYLFDQLQRLRRQSDSSPETRQRISQLEQSLNALLEEI